MANKACIWGLDRRDSSIARLVRGEGRRVPQHDLEPQSGISHPKELDDPESDSREGDDCVEESLNEAMKNPQRGKGPLHCGWARGVRVSGKVLMETELSPLAGIILVRPSLCGPRISPRGE